MTLPHPAEHGAYLPGTGYYDANLRRYVRDQTSLTATATAPPIYSHNAASFGAWAEASAFKVNPELEALARLRDSDRPEQRAQAERMLTGTTRMALASYEREKAGSVATNPQG